MAGWKLLIVGFLCAALSGCMTCFDIATHGPRAFGGMRFFGGVAEETFAAAQVERPYEYATRGPPGMGSVVSIFFPLCVIDLPLSLALDIVLLPVTIPAEVGRANRKR